MKGLQDRNNLLLDGRTVENKGELILGYLSLTEYSYQRITWKSEMIKMLKRKEVCDTYLTSL
jgi:hypothetical protein